jgi:hypothetical protein
MASGFPLVDRGEFGEAEVMVSAIHLGDEQRLKYPARFDEAIGGTSVYRALYMPLFVDLASLRVRQLNDYASWLVVFHYWMYSMDTWTPGIKGSRLWLFFPVAQSRLGSV